MTEKRDPATNITQNLADLVEDDKILTTSNGAPVDSLTASITVGPHGDLVLKDFVLLDHLAAFDHERIPPRVVHGKGAGAHGVFEVTNQEFSQYCKAGMFSEVGKRTPLMVRFSTVRSDPGTADTIRDPRGFAIKFYTEEGNWDLVGNNTPIFFIRDPILFPSLIHSQKRNPTTNCIDFDAFWDFLSLRPESLHQTTFLFSDRGLPDGLRYMNGYGSHTFTVVNAQGERHYVKFHMKSKQGIRNLSNEEGEILAGIDPDYATRDLFNAIAIDQFPSWTMFVQIMPLHQVNTLSFDPFDLTKVWPHHDFPLHEIGMLTLNRNVNNYFAEVEQVAFSPGHFIPGIEASPDKMLLARMFSYNDTQRHRLGSNAQCLPINRPIIPVTNYQRDGSMQCTDNQSGLPNYFPNSFKGSLPVPSVATLQPPLIASEPIEIKRYEGHVDQEDNVSQCRIFYREVLDEAGRIRLIDNLANHLMHAQGFIQHRMIENLMSVDKEYGVRVKQKMKELLEKHPMMINQST